MYYNYHKKIAENLLKNTPIQTVYVEAETVQKDKETLVCVNDAGEQKFIGLDDTLGLYAYIRQYDNIKFNVIGVEGNNYLYNASVPLRFVVCGVNMGLSAESLIMNVIMNFKGLPLQLNQMITDSDKLFLMENKVQKQVVLNGSVYIGVDAILNVPFSMVDCKEAIDCKNEKRIFKKCDFVI